MAVAMDAAELRQRAIGRAIALGVAGEVVRVRRGWYRVPSTTQPATVYTVRVVDGRYTCDCPAGRSGRPCVHAAGVYIRKLESGGGRVTGPAQPQLPANVTRLPERRAA